MFDIHIYAVGLAVVLSIAVTAWLVSIPKQDVSFVDSLWSLFFLVLTLVYLTWAPTLETRAYILLFAVMI